VAALGPPVDDGSGAAVVVAQWAPPSTGNPDGFAAYRSTDGGTTWTLIHEEPVAGAIAFGPSAAALDGQQMVVAAQPSDTLYLSGDAGLSFTVKAGTGLTDAASVSVGDATHLWAVEQVNGCTTGKSGCFSTSGLFASSDGGSSWSAVAVP
jgi:photosystem II stability/assembly factor-like uncharacterized protein